MRKLISITILVISMFVCQVVNAQTYIGKSSKMLSSVSAATASYVVFVGRGELTGFIITTDGTNNGLCTAYDSATATTTIPITPTITTSGSDLTGGFQSFVPITFSKGLYIVVSGTGSVCTPYIIK